MSNNHKELIKKYFNSLVDQFIPNQTNISFTIVFKDGLGSEGNTETLGHTDWSWRGYKGEVASGEHTFIVSFLNYYKDPERWRGTVVHEFVHLYLFAKIGNHTHDDRFYSLMEKFENWMDQKWGLTPRRDKSGDWEQHIDPNKNEEKQKKPCTSCGEREIPYNTSGECFSCHQGQIERNRKAEANNQERKQEQEEFNRLDDSITNSKDLATLEKNWQAIQNNPLYSSSKRSFKKYTNGEVFMDNKTELDKSYTNHKSKLQLSQDKSDSTNNEKDEYNRLVDLIINSKNLEELEKNYQTIKSSPIYDSGKRTFNKFSNISRTPEDNKTELDILYNDCKSHLQSQNSSDSTQDYNRERERERERERANSNPDCWIRSNY